MKLPTDFFEFPKMARLFRDMVITEKLDGTNAQILIVPAKDASYEDASKAVWIGNQTEEGEVHIFAGSRTRWLMPGKSTDNYGFAQWVKENAEDLKRLGPGRHYGEWWGQGIQRNYGQTKKHFSLFNVGRWEPMIGPADNGVWIKTGGGVVMGPSCVRVVPTLYRGQFNSGMVRRIADDLRVLGSEAAPGFMDPEGVITFHEAAKVGFKTTLKDDDVPKSML